MQKTTSSSRDTGKNRTDGVLTQRFERHISTAGRCVAAGHAVGSEAATGAAKPPAGSAQPTPPASQS
ncbi:hypothetical protein NQ317_005246 [Molorchus minor]|uniref:Uncharacterized protein n=1 Tax=Molorchus minor TaxID=1323400 RepID=A0ABQ9JFW6_9CUCU|nr:hypothetical protein NQ317_005246 [Molorchus minor]